MKKAKSVEDFFENLTIWKDELTMIRAILLKSDLKEEIKWGVPTYCLGGKNVVGFAGFKSYFGLWFFQGVFLKDSENMLINAQEGVTKALRQWRFSSIKDINEKLILKYVNEATQIQLNGKGHINVKKTEFILDDLLGNLLKENKSVLKYFQCLTIGKQKEYSLFISEAKKEIKKQKRLEKIIPMIKAGVGLNDKYKNN